MKSGKRRWRWRSLIATARGAWHLEFAERENAGHVARRGRFFLPKRNEQFKVRNEMGCPALPNLPAARRRFVTMRALPARPGMEAETFAYLADTDEWVAEDDDDLRTIRAAIPDAKITITP